MTKKRKLDVHKNSGWKRRNEHDDSMLTMRSEEDVADSEDEFHINRDKILLDENPAAKRLRRLEEEDQFLEHSEEEILDDGLDDENEEEEDDEKDIDEYDESEASSAREYRTGNQDESEDLSGWGPSRRDYYNTDVIETEQDALDEETEALRIQKKQLQAMTEADFGLDEDEWMERNDEKDAGADTVVTEILPQLQITDSMSEEEKMKIMRIRYPEFEHISREYLRLQPLHEELAASAKATERVLKTKVLKTATADTKATSTPIAITKYRACAAYLAAMAMYFAILGSTAKEDGTRVIALDPAELHEHPIMESLLKFQKIWDRVESLPVADPMIEAVNSGESSVVDDDGNPVAPLQSDIIPVVHKYVKQRKSRAQSAAVAQAKAADRRASKLAKVEKELASLGSLVKTEAVGERSREKKSKQAKLNLLNADDSDFGEETSLGAHELAEKARKKKSLRFYTSQIAQKVNKRDAAGKDYGGDADVPHRERLKDRQARLQAEAEKRGRSKDIGSDAALVEGGDDSSAEEFLARSKDELEDEEGYYNMVATRSDAKKQGKLDRSAAYALAAKENAQVIETEVMGEDGRRMITYQIAKNKGMTPHRKKSVRNPRVKKREKYKQKTRKLKSMKSVFDSTKAAKGSANYGGELTGIKTGLVRSRKL